jgi:hemerythrin
MAQNFLRHFHFWAFSPVDRGNDHPTRKNLSLSPDRAVRQDHSSHCYATETPFLYANRRMTIALLHMQRELFRLLFGLCAAAAPGTPTGVRRVCPGRTGIIVNLFCKRNQTMSLIKWTPEEFATSVSQHDEEHKHLFGLLNGLHASVGTGERGAIGRSLDGLIAFVAEHFAAEEENMRKVSYPALDLHRLEHDKLVKTCINLQQQFHAGQTHITEETTAFLRDWLKQHIPHIDRQYGPALAAI